jgi:hypothetical protein
MTHHLNNLVQAGQERGFEVEQDVDYGAGLIDVIWSINLHSALPNIKCGFVMLRSEEGGNQDTQDNQLSLRKIEEAAFRGIRSGLDKVYLVAENEERAKSVSGKIEWLASHGSILRLDAVSLGLSMDQRGSSVVTPSQKRVPEGEKLRKYAMRKREAKIDKYNRPKGERRVRESKEKRKEREEKLERISRTKGQKLKKNRIR